MRRPTNHVKWHTNINLFIVYSYKSTYFVLYTYFWSSSRFSLFVVSQMSKSCSTLTSRMKCASSSYKTTATATKNTLTCTMPQSTHTHILKLETSITTRWYLNCYWINKWFIAYSSSMLDGTWNIKTLKQEHTAQNHRAALSKNIQLYSWLWKVFQTVR